MEIDSAVANISGAVMLLLVDDASEDNSIDVARKYKPLRFKLKIIKMRSNSGHMNALTAGFKHIGRNARWVASMDADLQDPPQLLREMYEIAKSGNFDVIQAVRKKRASDTFFKKISALFFYRISNLLIPTKTIAQAADFRMMTSDISFQLSTLKEKRKVFRFLIPAMGYRIAVVEFERQQRFAGKTKYPLIKMIKLGTDSIISFSARPLHIITFVGFVSSILLLTTTIVLFVASLNYEFIPGWASIITIILFTQAILLTSIGIVGEYISRIYELALDRPDIDYIEISEDRDT
jgi:glycosyltransferase involved in cell wall biosynthesis